MSWYAPPCSLYPSGDTQKLKFIALLTLSSLALLSPTFADEQDMPQPSTSDTGLSQQAQEVLPAGRTTPWLQPPSINNRQNASGGQDLWRIDPEAIDQVLIRGEAAFVDLPAPPAEIILGNPSVAQITLIPANPQRLVITATGLGITNLIVFAEDGTQQLAIRVRVLREYTGITAQDMLGPIETQPNTVVVCRPGAGAGSRIECQEIQTRF